MDIQGRHWVISNDHTKECFEKHLDKMYKSKGYVTIRWTEGKTRSNAQNNALHLYCRRLAEVLNDRGLPMQKVLEKKSVDVLWSGERVKETLWKPVQEALIGTESTADANTVDYDKVHEVLSHHLGQVFSKHDLYVPFPNKE